jgi:hypothetical protein
MLQRQTPRSQSAGFVNEALNVDFVGGVPGSRPGMVPFHGADFPEEIVGVKWHVNADGTRILLAAGRLGGLYTCFPGSDPVTLALTNLPVVDQTRSAVEVVHFLSLSGGLNTTFIYDGVNQNLKFDGTTLTKMGISTPPAPNPEGAHAAGNVTAGVRLYKLTLKSTTHESDVSTDPLSVTVAPGASQQYDIPSPVQGVDYDDPQVVTWALYSTVAGGGTYYFVDEADISVDITVDVADVILKNQGQAEELVNTPPPAPAVALVEHRGQLAGVFNDDLGLVRFSNIDPDYMVPEGWPEDFVQPVAHGDGDELTALASLHEWLVCFKIVATYGVIGESFDEYKVVPVLAAPASRQGIGCLNPDGILQVENAIMFPARDGIYKIDRFQGGGGLVADRMTGSIDDLYAAYIFSLGAATFFDRKKRVANWLGHG